jgi:hypothetical protein
VSLTAVRIQTGPPRCSIAFGQAAALEPAHRPTRALFRGGQIVAYLIEQPPRRALYLLRAGAGRGATTRLPGISSRVSLLAVATTARTVTKARAVLRYLARQRGAAGIDALPDGFWLRLADFIGRRRYDILPVAAALMEATDCRRL